MSYLNETPQYIAAADYERLLSEYPEAMNFSSAEPGFLHPCYHMQKFREINASGFGQLNTIPSEMREKMRLFLQNKIGTDVPEESFVFSLSTFRIFRALLNCLPRIHSSTDNADNKYRDTTILLSPQGAYFLFNRIAGSVLERGDCIETIWTHEDERYKLCAADIQRWADENLDRLSGRPLLLLLENPSICGHLYTEEELSAIDKACAQYNIYIFTDEVYRETCHLGEEFVPLASCAKNMERVISVFALSKSYGNLQYSLSLAYVPKTLKRYIQGYIGDDWRSTTLHHNFITNEIINEKDTAYLEEARALYGHKAKLVSQHIENLNARLERPLKMIYEPQAGYATVIDFTQAIMGVDEFDVDPQFKHHIRFFKRLAKQGLVLQSLHASGVRNRLCFRMVYGKHTEVEIGSAFQIIENLLT